MTRFSLALSLAVLFGSQPLPAQFEITAHGGVHFDRAPEHDRMLASNSALMMSDKGEAGAIGVRLGYWHRPTFGFQVDVTRSSNGSWSGYTTLPPASVINRTTFLSARAILRTSPANGFQLAVGAGPAVMRFGGTGTNLRTRDTDIGGVVEVSARVRVMGRLGLELAASNYLYSSTYTAGSAPGGGSAGRVFRHDLVLLPGVSWTL